MERPTACPSGLPVPAVQIRGIACRMFNTSWAKVTQIELGSPAGISAFHRVWAHGSATAAMQRQQRMTAYPLLMKVPSRARSALLACAAVTWFVVAAVGAQAETREIFVKPSETDPAIKARSLACPERLARTSSPRRPKRKASEAIPSEASEPDLGGPGPDCPGPLRLATLRVINLLE